MSILLLTISFLLTQTVYGRIQNGHNYWNSRYSSYGIDYPQWNGFWYLDGYRSVDVTPQTTSTCKIVKNALRCATGVTTL